MGFCGVTEEFTSRCFIGRLRMVHGVKPMVQIPGNGIPDEDEEKLQHIVDALIERAQASEKPLATLGNFVHMCTYVACTGEEGFPIPDDPEAPFVDDVLFADNAMWKPIGAMTDDDHYHVRLVSRILEWLANCIVVYIDEGEQNTTQH